MLALDSVITFFFLLIYNFGLLYDCNQYNSFISSDLFLRLENIQLKAN